MSLSNLNVILIPFCIISLQYSWTVLNLSICHIVSFIEFSASRGGGVLVHLLSYEVSVGDVVVDRDRGVGRTRRGKKLNEVRHARDRSSNVVTSRCDNSRCWAGIQRTTNCQCRATIRPRVLPPSIVVRRSSLSHRAVVAAAVRSSPAFAKIGNPPPTSSSTPIGPISSFFGVDRRSAIFPPRGRYHARSRASRSTSCVRR